MKKNKIKFAEFRALEHRALPSQLKRLLIYQSSLFIHCPPNNLAAKSP